jgi:hypothetical protein
MKKVDLFFTSVASKYSLCLAEFWWDKVYLDA